MRTNVLLLFEVTKSCTLSHSSTRESSLLRRLERGREVGLWAMQETKALISAMTGVSGWFSSGGPRGRFLTRYDGEVSEPLVGRQGSRVSMRVRFQTWSLPGAKWLLGLGVCRRHSPHSDLGREPHSWTPYLSTLVPPHPQQPCKAAPNLPEEHVL